MNMKNLVATSLQILGLAIVTAGVFLLSVPVGLIVAGAAVTVVGISVGMNE